MIETISYPRAALVGNPSDGYYGKTISFVFNNFYAKVALQESDMIEIIPCSRERLKFQNADDLVNEIKEHGYYGGVRLIKAAIKVFFERFNHVEKIKEKKFTISYSSTIPGRLGLAGSSAIVTSAMKAIAEFYKIDIPKPVLANLILSAEKDELKIGAGLQDRVAQAYNCPVYMNFDKNIMNVQGFGEYIPFDKNLLPSLYIAYHTNLSEGSEITHNDLASRYSKNDAEVLEAIEQWKTLTEHTWKKLQAGDKNIGDILNRNFDIRNKLLNISKGNLELINTARSVGASSKFTGSGGAIIGTYDGDEMYEQLVFAMKKINAVVIKPQIV